MRPALVLVLAFLILGGVKWFLGAHELPAGVQGSGLQLIQASDEYAVELTLTFDVGPDEFSLEPVEDAPSLLVQLNGGELLKETDRIAAVDSPILLNAVQGLVVGENEFYVQASPSGGDALAPRSIRIRVLQGGNVVADDSMWAEPGDLVQGTVKLKVTQ
jgi:hypothetical protein